MQPYKIRIKSKARDKFCRRISNHTKMRQTEIQYPNESIGCDAVNPYNQKYISGRKKINIKTYRIKNLNSSKKDTKATRKPRHRLNAHPVRKNVPKLYRKTKKRPVRYVFKNQKINEFTGRIQRICYQRIGNKNSTFNPYPLLDKGTLNMIDFNYENSSCPRFIQGKRHCLASCKCH